MKLTRAELADLEWRMERDAANTVDCSRCQSRPGENCLNPLTGDELQAPAHFQRIAAARDTDPSCTTTRPPAPEETTDDREP